MKYYLGLDNGGTTTKAALYAQDGTEIGVASVDTKMITPRPNFTERDMEEMWQANISVIRQIIEKTGVASEDIRSIAICGHGKGLYLWGKNNKPAYNGIISTDNRAGKYSCQWRIDGTEAKVFELTCQHILACQPVSLLAWLKDNEPETVENIRWIFECKDYIRFRLTGEARAELTDYSGANLINLYTRNYDRKIMDLFGLSDLWDALPPLCTSSELCGSVTEETAVLTGLKEGTPVAGGMFDIDACALATNVINEENICVIAGTWSINEYLRRKPIIDGSVLMNSLFCLPEYYLVEESSPTSAGNFEWFIRTQLPEMLEAKKNAGENIYDELNQMVGSVEIDDFTPIFLPFLMASNVNPDAKGSFIGISNYHTRAHIVRAIFEGIVFSHKYHIDKLLATRDFPPKRIRLAGGAARSKVWSEMFADVLHLPIDIVRVNEIGTLGCAVVAAVAVNDYPSLAVAAENMCSISNTVYPNPLNFEAYAQKYALYIEVIQALDPIWKTIREMIEK